MVAGLRQDNDDAWVQLFTDFIEGQAGINRAIFLKLLGTEWFPSIPDVHSRLSADPPARVADIGYGFGWSSIAIAQAYPNVQVDGYDLDGPSLERARRHAQDAGLDGRLKFYQRDASDPELTGRYDLVTAFECVHDMSDPFGALKTMLGLVGDTGAVIVIDERVGDTFTPSGNYFKQLCQTGLFACLVSRPFIVSVCIEKLDKDVHIEICCTS